VFDLRARALLDRKRVLQALLENVKGPIKFSEHLVEDGPNVFRNACGLALEGVTVPILIPAIGFVTCLAMMASALFR
jgi:ATP-dependent DNA ligase